MRECLAKVGPVFTAGDIDYRMFQTIVCRSDLTVDGEVLAAVAAELALTAARWPSMTQRRLAVHVDAIVARADALRRQKKTQADRNLGR